MNTDKASRIKNKNIISNEKSFVSKLCMTANKHTHKGLDKK